MQKNANVYGDAWRIAMPGVSITDALAANGNPLEDQLGLAAAVFTKASKDQGVLELTGRRRFRSWTRWPNSPFVDLQRRQAGR